MHRTSVVVVAVVACLVGALLMWLGTRWRSQSLPDGPALIVRIRDVARLETLDATLYKKVSFEPDPELTGTLWRDIGTWAKFTLRPPKGRAIVFATAHLGFDLQHLDASNVRVTGERVEVVLPPVQVHVELNPGETEIIGSNLDSAETSALFDRAKKAFEYDVTHDAALLKRARDSAEKSIRGMLLELRFREVRLVEKMPTVSAM